MLDNDTRPDESRRLFLKWTGSGVAATSLASFAGCIGNNDGNGDGSSEDGGDGDSDTQNTRYGGSLDVGLSAEPEHLFSANLSQVPAAQIFSNIAEFLGDYDHENDVVEPMALSSWEWEDDTTFIGEVREGMQFHQGYGEATAEDVVYHVNRVVEDPLFTIFLWSQNTEGASQIDEYTFQIDFSQPFSPFERTILPNVTIHSKEALEEKGDQTFGREPVYLGPFKFEEWVSGSHVTVSRFEDYWREDYPYVDEIRFQFIPDAATRMDQLRIGELDLIDRSRYQDVETVKENPDMELTSVEPGWTWDYMLVGGTESEQPALHDEKVRRAIAYAINREEIVEGAYFGEAMPNDTPLPPSYMDQVGEIEAGQYYGLSGDVDQATSLLEEAGYEDGFECEMVVETRSEKVRAAQIVQNQLSNLGIEVQLRQVDQATHDSMLAEGTYDIGYADIDIMSPDVDATAYWFYHQSAGVLNTMVWDQDDQDRVAELLDGQRATFDQEERMEMFREIFDIVLSSAPFIYTCNPNIPRVTGDHIEMEKDMWAPQDVWLSLWDTWLTE